MNLLNALLIVLNVALASWYMSRKCLSRHGVEINHVLAFTWGFLFYWILPVAVGSFRVFDGMLLMSEFHDLVDGVGSSKLAAYLAISLLAYLALIFGTERGERCRPKNKESGNRPFNMAIMNGYLILALVLAVAAAIPIKGEFFTGYTNVYGVEDLYNGRTVFAATLSFSTALWVLFTSMSHQKAEGAPVTPAIFANKFLLLYGIQAVLAVSIGSRYPVLSSAFMVGTYCSVFIKKFKWTAICAYAAILLVFAFGIGTLRSERGGYSENIVFGGLTETLYGSLSLFYFLREYTFGVLRWPVYLLSDYVYLVPRFLLPMKDSMLVSPEDAGFHIESPVGGVHSFLSFMVNFGALGTLIFLFLIFYGMGYLKSRKSSILCRTMYSMISGWMLISFFRNPFEVSLVKDIFQMSIVVPALVLGSVGFLSRYSQSKPALAGATAIPRT